MLSYSLKKLGLSKFCFAPTIRELSVLGVDVAVVVVVVAATVVVSDVESGVVVSLQMLGNN